MERSTASEKRGAQYRKTGMEGKGGISQKISVHSSRNIWFGPLVGRRMYRSHFKGSLLGPPVETESLINMLLVDG